MNKHEYERELDALRFTAEQKQQLADWMAEAQVPEVKIRKSHRRLGRIMILTAAALGVLVVGAGAVGALKPVSEVFAGIFGQEETEIMDNIGYPIGASDTEDGITITADAILGDAYNACIVYTIQREDGKELGVPASRLHFKEDAGCNLRGFSGSHGTSYFLDQNPADTAVQYIEIITGDEKLRQGRVKAKFSGLCYDDGKNNWIPVSDSTWKFSFQISYEDSSVSLANGQTFSQNGLNFTIDEVTLSPVAIRVGYTADQEVKWSDDPSGRLPDSDQRQMERYFEQVSIQIFKKDGSVIDLTNAGGSLNPEDGKTVCTKGEVLPEILPLDEVEAVIIGSVTIPYSPQ